MSAVRGGRDREKAEAESKADAQQMERRNAQHALDTRHCVTSPQFRRWLAYWLDKADVLTTVEPTLPHDALRAQLGKQYLGMQMLADVQAIDPAFITELWATTQEESDA